MKKIALVILNYLNYIDTFDCVNSIMQYDYNICGIVIVDNGSNNQSYHIIKNKYIHNPLIHVLRETSNLGFAKGNNIGINYARKKLLAEYVLVVNNDTIFINKDFIKNMLQEVKPGIGVLGPKILLKNRRIQNEYSIYTNFSDILAFYLVLWSYYFNVDVIGHIIEEKMLKNKTKTKVLHGCALLFTPEFFKYYKGFYPKTFLYNEEAILYNMLKKVKLKQVYVTNAIILHKEDRSSKLSYKNANNIRLKHNIKSFKYIFVTMLLPYSRLIQDN
ncbi:glycosyltransferase [Anaerocolumna sedimenticola]|uniref:Glycosyltransferase n=1 Tax=Anaerocolumna sedimenticola TaxID=2696063 RepID=A0A6P1TLA1_9FIRM|nr:glycosyltransferase family 2 protein [Anaerocolumna sedimenticola]QHQ60686.1 glycosyltransferase [Anaerocolumna sedimenticola]